MTATKAQLLDALATQLRDTLKAAADFDVQVEKGWVVNPTPPTVDVIIGPQARDPQTAGFGDIDGGHLFVVRARVATGDWDASQGILVAFMDDENDLCIPQAIYDDPTLNGYAADVDVHNATGFQLYPDLTAETLIGVQWDVLVFAGES